MEMEIVRRKRHTAGQYMCHEKPLIKLELNRGQVVVFQKSMELMGFKHNEAVMFGFNKKEKRGFLFKEYPQPDSYYLRNSSRGYSRFTSKDLMLYMVDVFDIPAEAKVVYFEIEKQPTEKGAFIFRLTDEI
jgi:hypothetical protein